MTDLTNPLPKLEGHGEPGTRLPRFNIRLTQRQIECLMRALNTLAHDCGSDPEEDAIYAALSIVANGTPTPEVVADISIAPQVTWHRFGGEACAD